MPTTNSSWKTTASAVLGLISLVTGVVTSLINGTPVAWEMVIPAFLSLLGVLFAKDWNVSGLDKSEKESE